MADKSADPETLLDVDTLILDYLLHVATSTLLDIARAHRSDDLPSTKKRQAELLIQMVSCAPIPLPRGPVPFELHLRAPTTIPNTPAAFLTVFHSNHPSAPTSPTVDFRLGLLKFTTLFTKRFNPSSSSSLSPAALSPLRLQRRERARLFRSHTDFLAGLDLSPFATDPFPASSLQKQRQRRSKAFARSSDSDSTSTVDSDTPAEGPSETFYGTSASLSLLDTLPPFMALCAAQTALHGNSPTDRFLRLAARYMAEAALEQYLVYGSAGTGPLLEAFAYGFDGASTADAGSEELAVTNMFWGGEDEREVQGWRVMREEHLRAVSFLFTRFVLCFGWVGDGGRG